MTATLDLPRVSKLAAVFPDLPWVRVDAKRFFYDRGIRRSRTDWSPTEELSSLKFTGGVYAILLPTAWFSQGRILKLHGPHSLKKRKIPFRFTLPTFADGYGVAYVGRTTNFQQRWSGHFGNGERNDGGQVKYGLSDCGVATTLVRARDMLREHAKIIYTALDGTEQCANRDILEMALCARFAPPFNIKSER